MKDFFLKLGKQSVNPIFAAVILFFNLMAALMYPIGFANSMYMSWIAVVLLLVGVVVFIGLYIFKPTSKYAPFILWAFNLFALFDFILNVYMYLTEVFYDGKITFDKMANIDPFFIICLILFITAFVLSNIGIWKNKDNVKKEDIQ